jgi:hypothetical protein
MIVTLHDSAITTCPTHYKLLRQRKDRVNILDEQQAVRFINVPRNFQLPDNNTNTSVSRTGRYGHMATSLSCHLLWTVRTFDGHLNYPNAVDSSERIFHGTQKHILLQYFRINFKCRLRGRIAIILAKFVPSKTTWSRNISRYADLSIRYLFRLTSFVIIDFKSFFLRYNL